jgi:N-methylhydantoinase A
MIRVATDAGGTFTDLIGLEETSGKIYVAKALTTPKDPSQGVIDSVLQGREAGLVTSKVSFFVHGGTTVINAITERKGVRTAIVTTRGFRDVVAIGRGNRPNLYNLHARPPDPFVPRHLRFEVTERIDAKGKVRTPLSISEVEAVVQKIAAAGVEAVAVIFLHAYINPAHEAAAAAKLRSLLPAVAVTASHEISRQWREYERSNTAVLSAYVQPIMARYLANLRAALVDTGVACPCFCMQSNGGLAEFGAVELAPLVLIESGPAGGVAGSVRVGEALDETELLYLDVGGTTAKCSLVRNGRPVLRPDYKLEWSRLNPGYPLQVPVVDIVEIGAGGGSIARVDDNGGLRVGPQSAGSDPGPACYGRGGKDATVTDAAVLTGMVDPQTFAGGRMKLNPDLSAAAVAPIASALKLSIVAAAKAVIRLAEANMINALKLVTIQRGHDPRDLTMVVSGGGGPMHAATLGRELGVKRIVIPRYAGLFSAWGMLAARPRLDLHRTRLLPLDESTLAAAQEIFAEMETEALRRFEASKNSMLFDRAIEMRYVGQEHTVSTRVEPTAGLDALVAAFHAAHEKAYTFRLENTAMELVTFHLAAEIDTPRIGMQEISVDGTSDDAVIGRRKLHVGGDEAAPAPVFDRDQLPGGARFAGPALVEEATATTVVLAGQTVTIDRWGLILIEEAREKSPVV